ncbi:TfoX/Sxy family protein [Microbacterium sp.]|uniref:TfoX/Sxy family protein n=1 Tax=Microbacterium sp. TaxID=51671 RepID=UPI0039E4E0F4
MTPKRDELADRVRMMVVGAEQKRMFGSIAFLVDGRILVCTWGDGDLLVRVDPDRGPELCLQPGVAVAEMGPSRRTMGPGWLAVSGEVIATDEELLEWIDIAREFHAASGA